MPASMAGRILRFRAGHDVPFWEQSDRMYGPFIPNIAMMTRWYDPGSGNEARHPYERAIRPSEYPSLIFSSAGTFTGRDTTARPVPQLAQAAMAARSLNPWAVLGDWLADSSNARVTGKCFYRDAWRVVLERNDERLYLTEYDATPIKLERVESHYLWGQVKAEYLWNTWWGVRGAVEALYPLATFRSFDGALYERIGVQQGSVVLITPDSAPRLTPPVVQAAVAAPGPPASITPDTVRVGENTFLLVTPAYTHAVTLQRDTVFLFDATTSEARSRGDSAVIAQLFPAFRTVALVVTDLAWPHISGVRFWVARGATVYSASTSETFLRSVVNRKWTINPDALEKGRAKGSFRFRAVTDSLRLAGGSIVLYSMPGATTETAVAAWVPKLRFLWAGDYIQPSPDSPYSRDVISFIRTIGIRPDKVAAQHTRLLQWSQLAK
jgi:hypothetical protein